MIVCGKSLNEEIKAARLANKTRVAFKGFTLNINDNTDLIAREDLTKNRFFAILHLHAHRQYMISTRSDTPIEFEVSPLLFKVIIDEGSELYPFRFLIGSGLQYNWREFIEVTKKSVLYNNMKVFFIACMLLDYLAICNASINEGTAADELESFTQYFRSGTTSKGQTMMAAVRNIGPTIFDDILKNENLIREMGEIAEAVKIDWRASQTAKNAQRFDDLIVKRFNPVNA